jgi:hypothetical protein
MFPRGRAGIALLLLRLALGGAIIGGAGTAPFWAVAAYSICATAICLGLLTPIAAGAYLVLMLLGSLWADGAPTALQVCVLVDAAVLALLGPGAYSIDARLFGRQRIIIAGEGRQRRK